MLHRSKNTLKTCVHDTCKHWAEKRSQNGGINVRSYNSRICMRKGFAVCRYNHLWGRVITHCMKKSTLGINPNGTLQPSPWWRYWDASPRGPFRNKGLTILGSGSAAWRQPSPTFSFGNFLDQGVLLFKVLPPSQYGQKLSS